MAVSVTADIWGELSCPALPGSAAILFNGIKESWRLARKILSQFKLLWFLNVFLVLTVILEILTLLTILHLPFCCRQR